MTCSLSDLPQWLIACMDSSAVPNSYMQITISGSLALDRNLFSSPGLQRVMIRLLEMLRISEDRVLLQQPGVQRVRIRVLKMLRRSADFQQPDAVASAADDQSWRRDC